ncbi:hypothetical protein DWV07_11235 [Dickeya zeae]|nr:hypothetical protein DWV07_11235 [Dickeya zeae]
MKTQRAPIAFRKSLVKQACLFPARISKMFSKQRPQIWRQSLQVIGSKGIMRLHDNAR